LFISHLDILFYMFSVAFSSAFGFGLILVCLLNEIFGTSSSSDFSLTFNVVRDHGRCDAILFRIILSVKQLRMGMQNIFSIASRVVDRNAVIS